MSDQKEPLHRITGGAGTYPDPHVLRSDLLNMIDRIPGSGYHYEPQRIAEAREKLAVTDVTDETRARLGARILQKEYRWHRARANYLVQLAVGATGPPRLVAARRADLLDEARTSRVALQAFEAEHPDIEVIGHRTVPTVDELIALHEARRRAR